MRKVVRRRMAAVSVVTLTMGLIGGLEAAALSVPPVAPHAAYRPAAEMELRVVGESANLRERPSPSGRVLAELRRGTKVIVLEKVSPGWARVRADDAQGYVDTEQGLMALDLDEGF
jgi:uncharacterized protein YgiM (DUF1202 family)